MPERLDSIRVLRNKLDRLLRLIKESKHIVALTGAGISTGEHAHTCTYQGLRAHPRTQIIPVRPLHPITPITSHITRAYLHTAIHS